MAVLQMSKICICAVKKDRKRILEFLQRCGCIEIQDSIGAEQGYIDEGQPSTGDVFQKEDTASACATLKKNAELARSGIAVLDRYCGHKRSPIAFLAGREKVSVEKNDAFADKRNGVLHAVQKVVSLARSIDEAKAEILRLDAREEALKPWMQLPVAQTFSGTKRTNVYIGSVEGEYPLDRLLARLAEAAPELDAFHVEIVSVSKVQTCFYLIASKRDAVLAEEALRNICFAVPANAAHRTPAAEKDRILEQKQQLSKQMQQAEKEIIGFADMHEEFRMLEDTMTMREEKYAVIQRMMHSKHTFVLNGYIAERDVEPLTRELTRRFDCAVTVESAEGDENAPIQLQNAKFAQPVESVIESYSMPSSSEIDPIPVMSVFYYVMFGLMFSDAGYGLIVALLCAVALKMFKDMEQGMKRNLNMFFWCGVSTLFWGIVFSSYFGDAINIISGTFFGREVGIPPLWFAPLDDPMKLLVFCLGIGCLHLTAGYMLKACNLLKSKAYIDIVYDVGFPMAILVCMLLVLMGSEMFVTMAGFRLTLSPVTANVCMGVAGISMVGILLTGGRDSRNWFKRLLKGLYALYNVLAGWISDILSYSRLLALGLATGVIASVFNSLGALGGRSVAGVLLFLFAFVVGHTLNFGINILGAYVHSNRLEFVEFFGKFYEGGGRKFLPFSVHTKHYRIVEED